MKSNSKVILFYFSGMRSYLLYKDVLEQNPSLFDCVIKMPAIPYKKTSRKRDFKKIFKVFFDSPGFFFMHLLTVKIFSFISYFFKTSIKDICKKNNIDYYVFKKIDENLLKFTQRKKPIWIVSSTSTILTQEFLDIPVNGVINFHEAPLPKYRGSASYFWFIVNNEKFANTTVHYVSEGLDTGDIICEGPNIPVLQKTVFTLWLKMLLSHKKSWDYIIPFLSSGNVLPSEPQPASSFKAYSYPDRKSIKNHSKKIIFFNLSDIKYIFETAKNGVISNPEKR